MCCVCLLLLSAPWKTAKPMSDVPRVARSVDDLRVGQWIATRGDDGWEARAERDAIAAKVRALMDKWRKCDCWDDCHCTDLHDDLSTILADPPARDWLVPATQMEALREAVTTVGQLTKPGPPMTPRETDEFHLWFAARAVLDAAREVEHE